jgi:hypothetical protein
MPRETIIPSVSVEVVKEVVPPSPAATGIVAILGATEMGDPLLPTRIDRFPTFREIFGAASVYSMPEAKHALQNGAKELVIVRLKEDETDRARKVLYSVTAPPNGVLKLTARAEGIWGNEIGVQVLDGRASGTHRIDLYYQDELLETFDNVTMHPGEDRYIIAIINSESELVKAQDLTGKLPVMEKEKTLTGGTDAAQSSLVLTGTVGTGTAGKKTADKKTAGTGTAGRVGTNMINIKAIKYGKEGDNIQITVEERTENGQNITVVDTTNPDNPENYEGVVLDPDNTEYYILNVLNNSTLITAELHEDYTPGSGNSDTLNAITNEPLVGGENMVPATYTIQDAKG